METLLGIFCKQPIPGKVKTRLARDLGDEPAARLYEAFLADIVSRLQGTADRRVLCYDAAATTARAYFASLSGGRYELLPQVDGNLGTRLAAFFDWSLADGPRKVLVIGSDCPTIPADVIHQAADALDHHDAVIGRSADGGYYLIGLRRMAASRFRRRVSAEACGGLSAVGNLRTDPGGVDRLFARIDWSTPEVYDQQQQQLAEAGFTVTSLPAVPEVDTADDLQQLLPSLLPSHCPRTFQTLSQLKLR